MTTPARFHRAAVLVNVGSRRGAGAYRRAVDLLMAAGVPVAGATAVGPGDDLTAVVARMVDEGHDLVVVGGGDGSIGTAAGVLAGTGVTLGVLPLGTANDLARTLQVPADLAEACTTVASGKVVDIDVGRVNGLPFLNVASTGLSVEVTRSLTPRLKRRLGPLAYPVAAVRAYRHHQPFRARLEFPDGDLETVELHDLLHLAVGNGRYYGGGQSVSPTADIDDHRLDIVAVLHGGLREKVRIARLLRDGTLVGHHHVHHATTRTVRVTTDPELEVNLDGEVRTTTPALFGIDRDALHVVVPQASTAARLGTESGRRVG